MFQSVSKFSTLTESPIMTSNWITISIALTTIAVVTAQENGRTFKNPILSTSSPDPFVIRYNGSYYMILSDSHRQMSVLRSDILTDWRNASRKIVYTAEADKDNLFAPEMHFIDGELYIYFAMDDGLDENHRMYVVKADDPTKPDGTYSDRKRIYVQEEDYFAIDGTPLQTQDGKLYFIWSGWPEATLGGKPFGSNLYIAPMANATTLSGKRVLLRQPTHTWEGTVQEGPEIIRSPFSNRTFIVYSAANTWDPTYCLTLLSLDDGKDPMLPASWIQLYDEPLFYGNPDEDVYGPGHASLTTSPDGKESWLIYHAMDETLTGSNRTARAQRFLWNLDGTPVFGRPHGFDFDLPVPSGQI